MWGPLWFTRPSPWPMRGAFNFELQLGSSSRPGKIPTVCIQAASLHCALKCLLLLSTYACCNASGNSIVSERCFHTYGHLFKFADFYFHNPALLKFRVAGSNVYRRFALLDVRIYRSMLLGRKYIRVFMCSILDLWSALNLLIMLLPQVWKPERVALHELFALEALQVLIVLTKILSTLFQSTRLRTPPWIDQRHRSRTITSLGYCRTYWIPDPNGRITNGMVLIVRPPRTGRDPCGTTLGLRLGFKRQPQSLSKIFSPCYG